MDCSWTRERVAAIGSGGQSAVAIGPLGYAQVAYCAGPEAAAEGQPGLRYAANFDGDWYTRDWAEADACEGPSLWLRGDGSFRASFAASLEFSGGWTLITCDGGDQPPPPLQPGVVSVEWAWSIAYPWKPEDYRARGSTSTAAYDHEPYFLAVAYHHDSGELRLAFTEGGLTSPLEVVDVGCPATSDVSIAFDAAGGLHGAWIACRQLRYARRDGGDWPLVTVADADERAVADASLAIAPDQSIVIAFRRGQDVGLATRSPDGDAWSPEDVDVDHAAIGVSLSIAPEGPVHLAWVDETLGLRHAQRAQGMWQVETLEAATPSGDAAIAAGPGGGLAISYRDGTDLQVLYRPCAPDG